MYEVIADFFQLARAQDRRNHCRCIRRAFM